MTEAEWDECDSLFAIASAIAPFRDQRKARLAIVECCHRVLDYMPAEIAAGVCVGAKIADKTATDEEVRTATESARQEFVSEERVGGQLRDTLRRLESREGRRDSQSEARILETQQRIGRSWERLKLARLARSAVTGKLGGDDVLLGMHHLDSHTACHLLRCVFGNPFRPISADPAWLTPTVVALADAVYADRAFDRLPILADALEEAGCDNAGVLAHCRGDGPHARGCWVVDLVLGKA